MFAADVDIRGIGLAAAPLFASRGRVFLFFREALVSVLGLVVHRPAGSAHLYGLYRRRFGCPGRVHRPDLIRSAKRVLAHLWEDSQL
jgi:hypothetical protein